MKNTKITQYQQNIDILKGFFKKPIILVIGILTLVATVLDSVVNFLFYGDFAEKITSEFLRFYNENIEIFEGYNSILKIDGNTESSFSLDVFAILTGVSFVLMFAHSRSKGNSLTSSAKLYKVLATIQYVIAFVVAVFCVLGIIVTLNIPLLPSHKALIIAALVIIGVIVFASGYSKLAFAKSILESMNSIYLSSKGARAFGVFTLLGVVVNIFITAAMFLMGADLLIILSSAFALVPELLIAIMAFMYDSYIFNFYEGKKKLPASTVVEKQEAVKNENNCNKCGTPITSEEIFCHICGNKL